MKQPFRVPTEELYRRCSILQADLQAKGIDGVLIVQRVDLFYFSGTAQNGFLYLPAKGEPLLLIKKYFPRARQESGLKHAVAINATREIPEHIARFHEKMPLVIGLEFDVLPVAYYENLRKRFKGAQFVDAAPLILKTRMVKSDWEIEQMDSTAALSRKTFDYMREAIRPGLSEIEFAGMFETFSRKQGHGAMLRVRNFLTEAYTWHLLSGGSGGKVGLLDSPASGEGTSAAFPCGAGPKLLARNEPIMIDFSSVLNGYHMDETRMFVMGNMPDMAHDAFQAALDIQNTVLANVKPGVIVGDLFEISIDRATVLGFDKEYLGPPGNKVSFIGHGVGLELVEPPFIARGHKDRLMPGMTLALEPKLVFENEFCVGVEDVFLVTESGYRMVTTLSTGIFKC